MSGEVRQLVAVAVLTLAAGCSWILPRPASPAREPQWAAQAGACSMQLGEQRRNRSLSAAGAADPLVIELGAEVAGDRTIHYGDLVRLRRGFSAADATALYVLRGAGERAALAGAVQEGAPLTLTPDDGGSAPRSVATVLLLKADVPSPQRPSSCDHTLRDGDFVFARVPDGPWLDVVAEDLRPSSGHQADGATCRLKRQRCADDRVGGVVCVNYFGCAQ